MNHLAHMFLSGDDSGLLVGNFIGDHVRGRDFSRFPDEVAAGIVMHRQIDSYTDTHPVVEESKRRLRPVFHKYAPVVADMYYDHFLGAGWPAYSETSLPVYAGRVYALLESRRQLMPERSGRFLDYMVRHDWLNGYASLEGLHNVLCGMARRARFESHMERAAAFLESHYASFRAEFENFFPDLQEFAAKTRKRNEG